MGTFGFSVQDALTAKAGRSASAHNRKYESFPERFDIGLAGEARDLAGVLGGQTLQQGWVSRRHLLGRQAVDALDIEVASRDGPFVSGRAVRRGHGQD